MRRKGRSGSAVRRGKYQYKPKKTIDNQPGLQQLTPAGSNKGGQVAKAFTHDGIGIITFKPNLEGQMMKTKELEISVLDHWVDVRGEDGRIITYPREEIFEIEWEDRW